MGSLAVLFGGYFLLYVLAKAVEKQQLEFYQAGLVFTVIWTFLKPVQLLLVGGSYAVGWYSLVPSLTGGLAAIILFALLRRTEDTIAAWLIAFAVGGYILLQMF